jgi:IMP dehydrogenase
MQFVNRLRKNNLWMSLGTKEEEHEFINWLYDNKIYKVIIDVNHGHHKAVKDMIVWIKKNYPGMTIMAGNVSSSEGIAFLKDAGADIIKIGNSFGASCTTIKATGFGVHPMHVAKAYREDTNDWDIPLCLDGGIRDVADIVKCLIYGNLVMLGKMFAGCDESGCEKVVSNYTLYKRYFGNASLLTKVINAPNLENHVRYIEGKSTLVESTGRLDNTMYSIIDGIRSGFSFVGARNLDEFQRIAPKQILYV